MSWICPKCDRELSSENATHYCARVSIDSLFEGKSAEQVLAFDKILSLVADWDDVAISATPNCIVFAHHKTFLVIRPMKAAIDVKFYTEVPPKKLAVHKSFVYGGKYVNNVRIAKVEEISDELISYVRESYKLL